MTDDTIKLPPMAIARLQALQRDVMVAQTMFQQYLDGCLHMGMPEDGKTQDWIFENDMAFHRVKSPETGKEETK